MVLGETFMKNRLIWGISDEYTAHINQINYEILKGNIYIQAMVSKDASLYGNIIMSGEIK
jgi:hypothetical protein